MSLNSKGPTSRIRRCVFGPIVLGKVQLPRIISVVAKCIFISIIIWECPWTSVTSANCCLLQELKIQILSHSALHKGGLKPNSHHFCSIDIIKLTVIHFSLRKIHILSPLPLNLDKFVMTTFQHLVQRPTNCCNSCFHSLN